MSTREPARPGITAVTPGSLTPNPFKPTPLNRRRFLTGVAVLGASLAVAG